MVLIILGIIVLIAIWVISLYNNLVKLRNRRQNAFADIDVQLRQRHDLESIFGSGGVHLLFEFICFFLRNKWIGRTMAN